MLYTLNVLMKLYGPALLAVLCVVLAVAARPGAQTAEATLHLGILDLQTPIENMLVLRGLLMLGALLSLASYFCIDFASLFPKHYTMAVYFDNDGITEILDEYTDKERAELKIASDYKQYQQSYFDELDSKLRGPVGAEGVFAAAGGKGRSAGTASFRLKKEKTGIQNYRIEESEGKLLHTLGGQGEEVKFWSFFEKKDSKYDSLSISVPKIMFTGSILIRPIYKQIISHGVREDGREIVHELCGATKARIIPFPKIGKTLYLYEHAEGLVPVAYAIYGID